MMIHSKDLFLLLEDCGGTCLFWLAKDGVFGYRPTDGDWKGEWGRRWGKGNLPRRLSGVSMRNRLNLLSWREVLWRRLLFLFVFTREKLKTLNGLHLVASNDALDLEGIWFNFSASFKVK